MPYMYRCSTLLATDNNIPPSGGVAVAEAMAAWPELQLLDLSRKWSATKLLNRRMRCQCVANTMLMRAVHSVLAFMPENNLECEGVAAVAEALPMCTKLQRICLSSELSRCRMPCSMCCVPQCVVTVTHCCAG